MLELVVISPEGADPREESAMEGMFERGLGRYHVRKPGWGLAELEAWVRALPASWRPLLVLHQHHALVPELGLGGVHQRDEGPAEGGALSRSCHDVRSLARVMARYSQVLFGPVFPSISKSGYGPPQGFPWSGLAALLSARRPEGCGRVLAVGGVGPGTLGRVHEMGFDGAALHGAVWAERDPAAAFARMRDEASVTGRKSDAP